MPADNLSDDRTSSATTPSVELLRNAAQLVDYLAQHLAPTSAQLDESALHTPRRLAAVLIPLYAVDGAPHLLFTRRSNDLPRHRGEISFPGGARDPGDPSLGATALRETAEELALDPVRVALVGVLPPVNASVSGFTVVPYVGWLGEGLPVLAPNAEVAEVITAPLAAVADVAIYHTEVWRRAGESHIIHFYDYGRHRIWGVTGHIVHELLSVLPRDAR